MINYISGLVFFVPLFVGAAVALAIGSVTVVLAVPIDVMDAVKAFTRDRHRRNGRHTPVANDPPHSVGLLEEQRVSKESTHL